MTRLLAASLVALALVGAQAPLDDGLASLKRAADTLPAEVAKLQATNATLLSQTAELKARLAAAERDVTAYATTHRQLAARIDKTTVVLGGTPPAPVPNNVGATLTASLVTLEATAKTAAEKLAQPPPPPEPTADARGASVVSVTMAHAASWEALYAVRDAALAWCRERGLAIATQPDGTPDLEVGWIDVSPFDPVTRPAVIIRLIPQAGHTYARPFVPMIERIEADTGADVIWYSAR